MQKSTFFIVCAVLLAGNVFLVEGKRSFSIGRSRKKAANINVRRKGAVPDVKSPISTVPYYGTTNTGRSSSIYDRPYPVISGNPSYADITGRVSYPIRRAYGSYVPLGSNSYLHGSHQTPNQGLYAGPQTMGSYGLTGGYGGRFGYGPYGFGNVFTGLAFLHLARGFNLHGRNERLDKLEQSSGAVNASSPSLDEAHDHVPESPQLTTIVPHSDDIAPSSHDSSTPSPHHVEDTTDHPSLWIYAINTVPIRSEVIVANKSSFMWSIRGRHLYPLSVSNILWRTCWLCDVGFTYE